MEQAILEAARKAAMNRGYDTVEERLARAELVMKEAGELTFGVEYCVCVDKELAYVNTGETYEPTIAIEGDGPAIIASWGGWYEAEEVAHCEGEDEVRCGYCGEFTDNDQENWADVTCSSCGRNVSTGELP